MKCLIKCLKPLIVLSLVGFHVQTFADHHADSGFFALNFNMIPNRQNISNMKGFSAGLSYGGPLSKDANAGLYELGIRAVHRVYGFQFKYSYPFYFGRVAIGPDASLIVGARTSSDPGSNESNFGLGGEAGLFGSMKVSKTVSVLVHLGANYRMSLKEPAFKPDHLDFHFGVSGRWHLP